MKEKELWNLFQSMTLAEKLGQMTQTTGEYFVGKEFAEELVVTGPAMEEMGFDSENIHRVGSVLGVSSSQAINAVQRAYLEKSRLGIPLMFMHVIVMAIGAPFIAKDFHIATPDMGNIKTYIPKFDFSYFTTISMLVFAVGGAEKISPYVNQTKNPAKEFPRGMFLLAGMVGICAVLGSIAMGMIFSSGNLPNDLMANGAYAAFQILGQHFGVGNFLMIVYALTNGVGQIAALAFSIDAPLRILLADADPEYVPAWLRKKTNKGTLKNGYTLTGILVSIIILLPLLGIGDMNELVKWLTNLNSVVMPMRYLWVFFAFIMLNRAVKHFQSEYKFIKQKRLAMIAGAWCFLFTLIACVLGMVPKLDYAANPSAWWFQLASNILTPIVLILLGMLLPFIARREQRKATSLDLDTIVTPD